MEQNLIDGLEKLIKLIPPPAIEIITNVYNYLDPMWWWGIEAALIALLFLIQIVRIVKNFRKKKSRKKEEIREKDFSETEKTAVESRETEIKESDVEEPALESPARMEPVPEEPVTREPAHEEPVPEEPVSFFERLKSGLSKTRHSISGSLDIIFSENRKIDDEMLEEIEELLITSDIGVSTTMDLMERITEKSSEIENIKQLKTAIKEEILSIINTDVELEEKSFTKPHVIMVVGVNGVGKTTTIGKLASRFTNDGKKVLIAASDTFRAAAIEQLTIWADRAGAEIVKHKDNADPSAVAYDSVDAAVARDMDIVLVDTAGRLHTRKNLMEEMKKIRRTISKKLPDAPHETLLVLDATTGQNALTQAKMFQKAIGITSIALTKLDGTAKGGIVVSICGTLNIPLKYIGVGEKTEDLQTFDPKEFVDALF